MLAVHIGNKYLSEFVARDKVYYLLDTLRVELVENIIKQQKRCLAALTAQKIELRQFERHQIALVLPLRTLLFYGVATELHHKLVAVNALCSVPHAVIVVARAAKSIGKVAF